MPLNGRPLGSLRALIILAECDMECCIPKGLPNLKELVLFAKGAAEVSFEDPVATLSAVEELYILGQLLQPNEIMGETEMCQGQTAWQGEASC